MKKIYITTFCFCLLGLGYGLMPRNVNARLSGSSFGANYSGINGGVTCNTSGCHTGQLNSGPGSVVIATDVPSNGYIGGTEYSISVIVNAGGANGNRYGFMASVVEEGTTTFAGVLSAADNTTVAQANGTRIAHSSSPNGNGVNSSHTFTFKWTAPVTGTGNVKVWAAGNSANGTGSTGGDQIYTNFLVIEEAPGAGLTENIVDAFNLYPNPANEFVQVNIPDVYSEGQIRVMDVTGKLVFEKYLNEKTLSINLAEFPSGLYIVQLNKGELSASMRLIKK
ncbi:MAG: T9SS type A sorting domain-containing protein [Flavobacteriales bacterium]|nr:T9SS type A sorting domain-containing protein [Flavobacteriales bacterium]